MIHLAAVNNVIWYGDRLEAYRSDKFSGFTKQPQNGGVITGQNGYWGFYGATPVTTPDGGQPGSGGVPGWAVGVGVAALVVALAAVAAVVLRRRATAADRE
jgi:peptide/nickel transport system substrate-binding protein